MLHTANNAKRSFIMYNSTNYLNKHYNINQKDEDTQDDGGRDGGTNFILRIYKEQESNLILPEHDDDDEQYKVWILTFLNFVLRPIAY